MRKFRTLAPDAERRLGPYLGAELTHMTSSEVTSVGRVLRATKLDELPQLYNVLRGDMSIVGPRPIRPAFFAELSPGDPPVLAPARRAPRPHGPRTAALTREMTWAEKLAHDFEYIADRSLRLYVDIILKTTWLVFLRPTSLCGAGTGR
jgi:lipopolysaccharide/colanic/teichoic acid biosynthesis glycosyltransferase